MPKVPLTFPFGGLNENVSYSEQPPLTTSDAKNVRGIDPKTGRVRGAQRAGTTRYLSTQLNGDHAVKDLNFVVVNDKKNTYAELADGSITSEWIAKTGGGNDVNDMVVDRNGNVYALDGDTGFSVINPDGDTVISTSVPVVTGKIRRIEIDDDLSVFVGISRDGTQTDARLWKYELSSDATKYDQVWEASLKTQLGTTGVVSYVTAMKAVGEWLYVLIYDLTNFQSECHVYTSTSIVIETPATSFDIENDVTLHDEARGLDVNDKGEILVASTNLSGTAGQQNQFLVKYDEFGAVLWTIDANTDDRDGVGSACLFDSNGDVYAMGSNSQDVGILTAGGLNHFFDKGSSVVLDWRADLSTADFTASSREFIRMAVDSVDNVYIPGPTVGQIDDFVRVYDRHGALLSTYADPASSNTGSLCVALTPSRPEYGDDAVTIDEFVYIGRVVTATTLTITGATNATPIVLSTSGGSWRTGEISRNVGILGTTSANGEWRVTNVTSSSWSLDGSAGNGVWSSGGSQVSNVLGSVEKVRLVSVTSSTGTQRTMTLAGVADGDIVKFTAPSTTASPNGGSSALDTASDWVQSVAHFGKIYYVDGKSTVVYDPADHTTSANGEVKTLLAKGLSGSVPKRCSLITSWRGRLVLARDSDDGHNWYMSARDDPENWDYFPPVITPTIAVAGNSSDVGRAPDIINTMIPWSDDLLIFGCDHSIWRLTGDPMDGGQIDQVPTDYGMAFGRPWTEGPRGEIYFFSSRGGVHVMAPSGERERLSVNTIERRLTDVDLSKYHVRLAWDYEREGLCVFLVERAVLTGHVSTGQATHYFWEAKTNSWWPDTYKVVTSIGDGATNVADLEPSAVMVIDGDAPSDRRVLIGRDGGTIDYFDNSAKNDDDGTTNAEIDSYVLMGPFFAKDQMRESRFTQFEFNLARDQEGMVYDLYASNDVDSIGSSLASGPIRPGANPLILERVTGRNLWVRIGNGSAKHRWAYERGTAVAYPAGRVRV